MHPFSELRPHRGCEAVPHELIHLQYTCFDPFLQTGAFTQAAKAIAVGCCNITLADLASPELVTDEAFHLITGALLMAKYGDAVLNLEKGVDET